MTTMICRKGTRHIARYCSQYIKDKKEQFCLLQRETKVEQNEFL